MKILVLICANKISVPRLQPYTLTPGRVPGQRPLRGPFRGAFMILDTLSGGPLPKTPAKKLSLGRYGPPKT